MVYIPFLFRKTCMYYGLVVLLLVNFFLLTFVYFYFLDRFTQSHRAEIIKEVTTTQPTIGLHQPEIQSHNRSFRIDYEHDTFLRDGKPFKYISGSLHYFRVPRVYWRDRLRKYRAAGLNAVSIYVEWGYHEPSPRNYQFTGEKDLEHFIDLAVEEDLLVILRPGPYICAERDLGGLPPWLLTLYPSIQLRANDEDYKREVKLWFDVLLPRMQKYLYGKGGPIIMMQVENEYGSFNACDKNYQIWLRDLMSSYVKDDAVLFTTDGPTPSFLNCGVIPNVYATVDFGTSQDLNSSFTAMRMYEPKGPLVNSEFYPGWLSTWDNPYQTVDTGLILSMMEQLFSANASFNFYMFFGGTNFGFMNGANINNGNRYDPQLSSYDYDAPLTEAGDPTEKYFAIRQLIGKYFPLPNIPLPKVTSKGNYGTVTLKPALSMFNYSFIADKKQQFSDKPSTFEQLEVHYGYVLYETCLPEEMDDPALLEVYQARDRIIVFIDESRTGILSRTRLIEKIPLSPKPNAKLQLLVENQGRVNYGPYLKDFKGLISTPTINGKLLNSWTITGFPFTNVAWVETLIPSTGGISPPAFYYGEFVLPEGSEPLHTYIDPTGWGKGVIFINNYNIGRYWPGIGSQVTLFVPACYLVAAPNVNKIVVFETDYAPKNYQMKFTDVQILNKLPPRLRV